MRTKMAVEEDNGVHSKENYPHKDKKDPYGEHIGMYGNKNLGSEKIIDCNRRGKTKDITDKDFILSEPELIE